MSNKLSTILALCLGLAFAGLAACDDDVEEVHVEESAGDEDIGEEVGDEVEETGEEIDEEF